MKYFTFLFFYINIFLTSSNQVYITRLQKDGLHCYANSLFQCLNNINILDYLTNFEFKSHICYNLSKIFKFLKEQSTDIDFCINENNLDRENINLKHKKTSFLRQDNNNLTTKNNLVEEYNNLIDYIDNKDLKKGTFNDPVEFLQLLLKKCLSSDNFEDFKFFKKFTFVHNKTIIGPITSSKQSLKYGLVGFFKNLGVCKLPKILTFIFGYKTGNENINFEILKYFKIQNQKYMLKSFIVNLNGNNGHFYAVLHINNKMYKVDDDNIHEVIFESHFKGVYMLFYEKCN